MKQIEQALHASMPPLPDRIKRLPVESRGFPVPWFVAWIDGKPDFRVIGEGKLLDAVKFRRCWVCGETLGSYLAFVIGPMCAVNRVSSEPPSHTECADFSAKACPFLTQPKMSRNEHNVVKEAEKGAGFGIRRNPGVALVWITRSYEIIRVREDVGHGIRAGVLFHVGDAIECRWYANGRQASRVEVLASIETGLPLLRKPAEEEGPDAVAALEKMLDDAMQLVPSQ